jgi:alpha-1,2-mannosyltransferase
VQVPVTLIDSNHYGKWVVAPLNIIKYNVFSSEGPDLYGTEPWTFYAVNLFLNFNIMFALAALSPILLLISWKMNAAVKEKSVVIGTMCVWFGVFLSQPHKVNILVRFKFERSTY